MVSTGEQARRAQIYEQLNREVRFSSSLTILFSQAVADRLGVHSTDIETVDLLHIMGPMTAGQLSEVTGLTTGATTRLIDRMERAGFARRRHDPNDRRRVVVEATTDNLDRVMPLFEPMGRRMAHLWSGYSVEQLETVVDFLKGANQIMTEENARLRAQSAREEAEALPGTQAGYGTHAPAPTIAHLLSRWSLEASIDLSKHVLDTRRAAAQVRDVYRQALQLLQKALLGGNRLLR